MSSSSSPSALIPFDPEDPVNNNANVVPSSFTDDLNSNNTNAIYASNEFDDLTFVDPANHGIMAPSVTESQISATVANVLADMNASFSWSLASNSSGVTNSNALALVASCTHDEKINPHFITLVWALTDQSVVPPNQIASANQVVLPFTAGAGQSQLRFRTSNNGDLVKDAVFLLSKSNPNVVVATCIGKTSQEQSDSIDSKQAADAMAAQIANALQIAQSDTGSYLQQLRSTDSNNTNDTASSTATTTTTTLSNSNFIDAKLEGRNVYRKDEVHQQIWEFYSMFVSAFQPFVVSTYADGSKVMRPATMALWDCQVTEFENNYPQLVSANGFVTSFFLVTDDTAESNDFFIYTLQTDSYTYLAYPNYFNMLLHFQLKSSTGDGFLFHRAQDNTAETASTVAAIFGPDDDSYLANLVQNVFAEWLWELRKNQHF